MLVGARAVLEAVAAVDESARMLRAAREIVRRLERALEQARYVGD